MPTPPSEKTLSVLRASALLSSQSGSEHQSAQTRDIHIKFIWQTCSRLVSVCIMSPSDYPSSSHSKFSHFNRLPISVPSGSRNMATWLSTPVSLTITDYISIVSVDVPDAIKYGVHKNILTFHQFLTLAILYSCCRSLTSKP